MKSYDFRDYYTNTRSQKLQESAKKLDREIKNRQLKESKTGLYKTSTRLANFYLNEAKHRMTSVSKVAEQVVRDTGTDKPNRVRAYVHESVKPSKLGKAVSKLSPEEQNSAQFALFHIQRSYPAYNLKEHFRSITQKAAEKFGGDPQAVFNALCEDNMHWQDYDMNAVESDDSWYDSATNEMLERVNNGEEATEVVNDLANQYAGDHPESTDAFEWAYDALTKRAWERGLMESLNEDHRQAEDGKVWVLQRPDGTLDTGIVGSHMQPLAVQAVGKYYPKHKRSKVGFETMQEQGYEFVQRRLVENQLRENDMPGKDRRKVKGLEKQEQDALSRMKRAKDPIKKDHYKKMAKQYSDERAEILDKHGLVEAEYQGRDVDLNEPFRNSSGSGKFGVYVTDPDNEEKVKKVTFGSEEMEIKRDDPDRRSNFRSRHNCDDKDFENDRDTAGYWSCQMWQKGKTVGDMLSDDIDLNEAYINSKDDAVKILSDLRKAGKKIETGQGEYEGNLANEYVNEVNDVLSWMQKRVDIDSKELKDIVGPVIELRKEAKQLETKPGSGKNARFGNAIANTLYPLINFINDKLPDRVQEDVTEMNPIVAVYGPDGKVIGRMDLKTAANIHDVPFKEAMREISRVGHYTDESITFEKQARQMGEDADLAEDDDGPCWDNYIMKGTKKKNGKTVPDCVGPVKEEDLEEYEKKKGADGKACWDGYRYEGTEDGKDKCVKVNRESIEEDIAQLLKRAGINETWNDDLIGGDEDTPDSDWIIERFEDLSNPRMMGDDYDTVRNQIVDELEGIGYERTEAESVVDETLHDEAEKRYNRQHNFESQELEEHEDYESYVEPWRKKGFDIKVKDLPGNEGGKLFNIKGGGKSFSIREPKAGVYKVGSSARDFDSFDAAMKDMLGDRVDEAALKDGPVKDKVVKAMQGVIKSHGGETWDNIKAAAKEMAEWYYEDLGFKNEAQAFEAIIRAYKEKASAPMFAEQTSHVKSRRAKASDLKKGSQVYHPAHGTGTVQSTGGGKVKVDFGQGKGTQNVKDTEVQIQEAYGADPHGGAMFSPYGDVPSDESMMQAEEDAKEMARELLSQYDEYDEAVHHDVVSDLKGWLENNGLNAGWDQRNLSRLVTQVANEMNLTRSSYMDMMKRLAGLQR